MKIVTQSLLFWKNFKLNLRFFLFCRIRVLKGKIIGKNKQIITHKETIVPARTIVSFTILENLKDIKVSLNNAQTTLTYPPAIPQLYLCPYVHIKTTGKPGKALCFNTFLPANNRDFTGCETGSLRIIHPQKSFFKKTFSNEHINTHKVSKRLK